MEIKFKVDTPAAKVDFEFSCNAEEAAVLINDPVYQELGKKLCSEISFIKSTGSQRNNNHTDHKANGNQPNDRVDALRKVVETEHKCQARRNEAVDKAISNLQDHVSRMLDRIVKDIRSKS